MQSTVAGTHLEYINYKHINVTFLFPVFAFPTDKASTVPIEPIIAACVVVFLTLVFGLIARRKRIMKVSECFKLSVCVLSCFSRVQLFVTP